MSDNKYTIEGLMALDEQLTRDIRDMVANHHGDIDDLKPKVQAMLAKRKEYYQKMELSKYFDDVD